MAESRSHITLVNTIVKYVHSILPEEVAMLVQHDSPDTLTRPEIVCDQFIPDVFFEYNGTLIIGEAKTIHDFDRKHSREQFISYLNRCDSFYGSSRLIVSLPWELIASGKNYFRDIKKNRNSTTPVIVLNEFGRKFIV